MQIHWALGRHPAPSCVRRIEACGLRTADAGPRAAPLQHSFAKGTCYQQKSLPVHRQRKVCTDDGCITSRRNSENSIPFLHCLTCLASTRYAQTTKVSLQSLQVRAAAQEANLQQAAIPVSDVARRALDTAANSTRQIGWISFWIQLSLSIVSGIILLFSVAFTSQVSRLLRCTSWTGVVYVADLCWCA